MVIKIQDELERVLSQKTPTPISVISSGLISAQAITGNITVKILDYQGNEVTALQPGDLFDVKVSYSLANPNAAGVCQLAITVSDGVNDVNTHYETISLSGTAPSGEIIIKDGVPGATTPFKMFSGQPTLHIQAYVYPGSSTDAPSFLSFSPKSTVGWY